MNSTQALSLFEFSQKIQGVITKAFYQESFWVIADISNHTYQYQKGFHFFDLVEKEERGNGLKAKLNASAWGLGAQKIKEFTQKTGQAFQNDIRVLCQVSVDFHPVYGLKLNLLDIDIHFTLGALERQRQEVLSRLLVECADFIRKIGDEYITRNKELPLSMVIQRLAIISSKNSAGFQDFEHTLVNNAFGYQFILDSYFALVQGEGNAEAIRKILVEIYQSGIPYDAVLILRGGGADTDFLIFETFSLGQVVAKYPIPIITGIGHQKNETIVDLMAHTSTKTPTKAAEFILAHNREFEQELIQIRQYIALLSQQLLREKMNDIHESRVYLLDFARTRIYESISRMEDIKSSLGIRIQKIQMNQINILQDTLNRINLNSKYRVQEKYRDIDNLSQVLRLSSRNLIQNQESKILSWQSLMQYMNPENLLKRGFSILRKGDQIITRTQNLEPGDLLDIYLWKEKMEVIIQKIESNGNEA